MFLSRLILAGVVVVAAVAAAGLVGQVAAGAVTPKIATNSLPLTSVILHVTRTTAWAAEEGRVAAAVVAVEVVGTMTVTMAPAVGEFASVVLESCTIKLSCYCRCNP